MSNPYKSTMLREDDRAFVLAPQSEESVAVFGSTSAAGSYARSGSLNVLSPAPIVSSSSPNIVKSTTLTAASATTPDTNSKTNATMSVTSTVPLLSVSEPIEMQPISNKEKKQ